MRVKEFAVRYHINLETLRNWEQHKRALDTTNLAYLICIAERPKFIEKLRLETIEAIKSGKSLTGKEGVLTPLIKNIIEASLEGEMQAHLADCDET